MTTAVRASITLGILGLLLLLLGAVPAVAQDVPTLEGDGVITYDHSSLEPLDNPTRQLLHGSAVEGGCAFDVAAEVGSNFKGTIVTREVAYDPATCQSLVEQSVIPAGVGLPDDVLADNTGAKFSQWTGYWRDPVNIPVNWNRSQLRWSYNLTMNRITAVHEGSCPKYRRSATGWRVAYDSGCYLRYIGTSKFGATSSRTFDNDWFPCGGIFIRGATTWVDDHELIAKANGYVEYSTNMGKSGPCSFLLWSQTILVLR